MGYGWDGYCVIGSLTCKYSGSKPSLSKLDEAPQAEVDSLARPTETYRTANQLFTLPNYLIRFHDRSLSSREAKLADATKIDQTTTSCGFAVS